MSHVVLICEKAQQAQAVAKAFGGTKKGNYFSIPSCQAFPRGALIYFASGHLLEFKKPDEISETMKQWKLDSLPFLPRRIAQKVSKSKSSSFNAIKHALSTASEIIISTDPAREGALIGYELVYYTRNENKPIHYLWSSSLTKQALQKAALNLKSKEETLPLYEEAKARAESDYHIGMNLSRLYTLLIQSRLTHMAAKKMGAFSVGRIQLPVTKMCVDREKEIQQFESKPFWEVKATFRTATGESYEGKWIKKKESRIFENEQAEHIKRLCESKKGLIYKKDVQEKNIQSSQFMNLSDLQILAEKKLKMTPKQTLATLQELYLKGVVSYPRTSTNHVTSDEAALFPKTLEHLSDREEYKHLFPVPISDISRNKRYVDASKVDDHYALIPTEKPLKEETVNDTENRLYDLIAKNFIAAHYDVHKRELTQFVTLVEKEMFHTVGSVTLDEGWKKVYGKGENDEEEKEQDLPVVNENEAVATDGIEVKESKTKPPQRYTQGGLIRLMKQKKLGTEATRSGIIDTILTREYISLEKGKVIATPKAFILVEAVGNHLLTEPDLTAKWEAYLELIGKGKKPPAPFVDKTKELITQTIQSAQQKANEWNFSSLEGNYLDTKSLGKCPLCGEGVVEKKSKKSTFFGCEGYGKTKCSFTLSNKVLGKSIPKAQITKLLDKGKTNKIRGFKKDDKTFDAYLEWNSEKGKIQFSFG